MDSRFIFHPEHLNTLNHTQTIHIDDISQNNTFDSDLQVHYSIVDSLKKNHRESYQLLAQTIKTKQTPIFPNDSYDHCVVRLSDAITNPMGVIITQKKTYLNGGCLCNSPQYMNLSYFDAKPKIPSYNKVITISSLWAEGIWHFPSEALVALMCFSKKELCDSQCKIHVSKKSSFIKQWFDILQISYDKVIDGFIHADTLLVPRMGKCGNPYNQQIQWLSCRLKDNLPNLQNSKRLVILVKRNLRRSVKNHTDIEKYVRQFANKKNLDVYIHDDSKLPSLQTQQEIFHRAQYVYAPHGAAGIHLFVMKPDSYYIEFLDLHNMNVCYMRLAYMRNISYIGIDMVNGIVNLNTLQSMSSQT